MSRKNHLKLKIPQTENALNTPNLLNIMGSLEDFTMLRRLLLAYSWAKPLYCISLVQEKIKIQSIISIECIALLYHLFKKLKNH